MADQFVEFPAVGSIASGVRHGLVTPGPAVLNPRPRYMVCNVAGTATIEDEAGVAVLYNLVLGQQINFRAVRVTSATAELIWSI